MDRTAEYSPKPDVPRRRAIKKTRMNEAIGVEIWVKKAATEFLAILLEVFTYLILNAGLKYCLICLSIDRLSFQFNSSYPKYNSSKKPNKNKHFTSNGRSIKQTVN